MTIYSLFNLIMLCRFLLFPSLFQVSNGVNLSIKRHWRKSKLFSTSSDISAGISNNHGTGDILVSGLNEQQDISVKVISCREIIQEFMIKQPMSSTAAKALGEVVACTLMMGSGLKNEESLQVNLVGKDGIRNVMAITDSDLKVRAMVGVPSYQARGDTSLNSVLDLFGEVGQVQVVRNHPYYKHPMSGITVMRDLSIPLNLGLYLAESEQRTAAMITDIKIDGFLCRCGLAVLVETLPGADPENVERAILNLQNVEKRGLNSYLIRTEEERLEEDSMFRSFENSLNRVLDDCLDGLGASITWTKEPKYACNCSVEKVWRALRLLPKTDVAELIETQNSVELKCEFCGTEYKVSKEEIESEILKVPSE